ncbi:hypothetical protein SPFL3102_03674 [Sporomusaceae bacterium FL31]|nr:hypothetical protein SPFL3101_02756 [Sporomusaceae bacterium FL31]GCE35821.1 hypothetical protein SPFL3102_03674 [Sporomusaceae bacterium]
MTSIDYTSLPLARLAVPVEQLMRIFTSNSGCKIGESTVVSKKLHIYNAVQPQEIQIMYNVDAGCLFYNRQDCNKIIHLDCFHECGQVDHHLVAAALRDAVSYYNTLVDAHPELSRTSIDPNLIDIQTSTGGGRITGNLAYGQKLALQNAHKNHVHVAALLPDRHTACLFFIVLAVESAIVACNLELRCIEKLTLAASSGNQLMDLSDYTDQTDSFLKSDTPSPQTQSDCQQTDGHSKEGEQSTYSIDQNPTAASLGSLNSQKRADSGQCDQQTLLGFPGSQEALPQQSCSRDHPMNSSNLHTIPDIEQHIRKLLKANQQNRQSKSKRSQHSDSFTAPRKLGYLAANNFADTLLDITATVQAAAARKLSTKNAAFHISGVDLRFNTVHAPQKSDICMILDASASMEGARLQTAKMLISRLMRSTICRLSLITFQDTTAQVRLPFSRSENSLTAALHSIQPYGATPLALGLRTGLEYLKTVHTHNPLMVLITDGLPSYASGNTDDPLIDAMTAAREIKALNYKFTCIGLESQQNYLIELAKLAGGTIYNKDNIVS